MNAIDPGAGYRLLKKGEEIREGDEFADNLNKWHPIAKASCGYTITTDIVRRKIEPGWIQGTPKKWPCQIYNKESGVHVTESQGEFCGGYKITHWRPLELAAPPEPEKPEVNMEMAAFNQFWMRLQVEIPSIDAFQIAERSWQAALQFSRPVHERMCGKEAAVFAEENQALKAKLAQERSDALAHLDEKHLAQNQREALKAKIEKARGLLLNGGAAFAKGEFSPLALALKALEEP